ncbi:MAG: hypothetical protein Q8736_02580, partial [Sweet potato little leaf phytoplasma]|nr:hypothetical protein [Sweet potato little leaf phytoplasma]
MNQFSKDGDDDFEDDDDTQSHYNANAVQQISKQKECNQESALSFTPEQHKAILALLQQSNAHQSHEHNANQLTTIRNTPKPSSGLLSATSKSHCLSISKGNNTCNWIIDTGATDHVTFNLAAFTSFKKIKPVLVKLPNGSQVFANVAGTVFFTPRLYLVDVLYIPSFTFNLISVSKLTNYLTCKLIFDKSLCIIQDLHSWKTIGAADDNDVLYALI